MNQSNQLNQTNQSNQSNQSSQSNQSGFQSKIIKLNFESQKKMEENSNFMDIKTNSQSQL